MFGPVLCVLEQLFFEECIDFVTIIYIQTIIHELNAMYSVYNLFDLVLTVAFDASINHDYAG